MKIKNLNAGDWVQFIGDNGQSQYGKFTKRCRNLGTNEDFTDLIMHNGQTYRLTDNDDFAVVQLPFSQKLDESIEVDMVKQPPHYQFGIFTANVIIEVVGKTYKSASVFYHVGNALKYLMRAPRKNGLQDLEKAKESVDMAIKVWEE